MKMLFDFRKRKMLRRDFHRHLSIKYHVIQTEVMQYVKEMKTKVQNLVNLHKMFQK